METWKTNRKVFATEVFKIDSTLHYRCVRHRMCSILSDTFFPRVFSEEEIQIQSHIFCLEIKGTRFIKVNYAAAAVAGLCLRKMAMLARFRQGGHFLELWTLSDGIHKGNL